MILNTTSLHYVVPTTQGTYSFTVSSDKYGHISVSSIIRNNVAYHGSYPLEVQTGINQAINRLEIIMSNISTLSGILTLNNQSEASVLFDSPLPNTDYRVIFSIEDFVFARVKSKTVTGFVLELSTAWSGTVKYDIIV
jgi:hypothetical protein